MMERKLLPCSFAGQVSAIPSKSLAHRALICAALCRESTEVYLSDASQDILATIDCLERLGASIENTANGLHVQPIQKPTQKVKLNCGESGSTLRFLLPVAAALTEESSFSGSGRLPERPLLPLLEALAVHGMKYSAASLPLSVSHWQKGGLFSLPGNISSQFASGILLAAPLLQEDLEISFSSPLESSSYLELSCQVMEIFGISIKKDSNSYMIEKEARYTSPGSFTVEVDWSNAAFWLTAGALSSHGIAVSGLNKDSAQGDRKVLELLEQMGASSYWRDDILYIMNRGRLNALSIDAADIPDLVPILAVAAACAKGTTRIEHISRLRHKESDRVATTVQLINDLGGMAQATEDKLIITGVEQLYGGKVQSYNDHRIAMAAAIAAAQSRDAIILQDSQAVAKSYPKFWQDYEKLGGQASVI